MASDSDDRDSDRAADAEGALPALLHPPLQAAWERTRARVDPRSEVLADALHTVAREARTRGAPVTALLRALDRLAAMDGGADGGFARVRAWAGTEIIRAYYRDD